MFSSSRTAEFVQKQKSWLVPIFFIVLAVVLRWATFYYSVIDWDESLYLLVSRAWLEGSPPYSMVWDNKPPGIYAIFAAALALLGRSVLSIRVTACLFVALSCVFLYRMGSLMDRNGERIGLIAGVLYAVSILSNDGMAANTELFFSAFTLLAFYLFLVNGFHCRHLAIIDYPVIFLIGLLLGIGFEIKYVVVFDFIALCAILSVGFIATVRPIRDWWQIIPAISIMSLGFITPFLIVSCYFWSTGHFDDYIYANFTANKLRIATDATIGGIYHKVRDNLTYIVAVPSITIFLCLAKTISSRERWIVCSLIVWVVTTSIFICVVLRGFRYDHYFLQISPALCLLTAYMIVRLAFATTRTEQFGLRPYLVLCALLLPLIGTKDVFDNTLLGAKQLYYRHFLGVSNWRDGPAQIAEYLRAKIHADDFIYVVDDQPIIYFLADAKIPTRYAFPPFLIMRPGMPNITGVDPLVELDLILQKKPVYIIRRKGREDVVYTFGNNRAFFDKLDRALDNTYHLEYSMDETNLYRVNMSP